MQLPPKKILVADDDAEQRDLYCELFQESGYVVTVAEDGLDALEKSLKEKPDLIFSGIIMPRMDGFEMIRNLRNNVSTSMVPVIMFSHLGREEDRKKVESLYLVDFMVKGTNTPKEILAKVKERLSGAGRGRPMAATASWELDDDRPGASMI
jgi:DNA-binding response OmpR family regulator